MLGKFLKIGGKVGGLAGTFGAALLPGLAVICAPAMAFWTVFSFVNKNLHGYLFSDFSFPKTFFVTVCAYFCIILPTIYPNLPKSASKLHATLFIALFPTAVYMIRVDYDRYISTCESIQKSEKLARGEKLIHYKSDQPIRVQLASSVETFGKSTDLIKELLKVATSEEINHLSVYSDGGKYTPLGFAIARKTTIDAQTLIDNSSQVDVDRVKSSWGCTNALQLALNTDDAPMILLIQSYYARKFSAESYQKVVNKLTPADRAKLNKFLTFGKKIE